MRWRYGLFVIALAGALCFDMTRPPSRQFSARAAIAGIRVYRSIVSPLLGAAGLQCRFTPSCSRYAEAVVARDGIVHGGWRALRRVARCGPWTPRGTQDPP